MDRVDAQVGQAADIFDNFSLDLLGFFWDADAIGDIDFDADADGVVFRVLFDMHAFDLVDMAKKAVKEVAFKRINAFDLGKALDNNGLENFAFNVSNEDRIGEL